MILEEDMAPGTLSVLNVGAGDMRFSFDSNDPQEVARAQRVVQDMLARGYILFVDVDGKLERVKRFNPKTNCYIIADGAMAAPSTVETIPETATPALRRPRGRPRKEREVPARKHKATGVAPTAGG